VARPTRRRKYGTPPRSCCHHGLARGATLTDEVAQLLRVSQRTVQVWIRDGMLTAVRYGRLLRVRQADLATFGEVLTRHTTPTADVSSSSAPAGAAQE
jgi:excisionase family DNA binding protein